jgi:3',5'-cyclic-AMP phosphodiesterase
MPIQLPPISRRNFLKRSLFTTAGFTLAPTMFAASRWVNKNSWALMADTHIAADPAKIARQINLTEHFKTVLQEILALPARPAGAFVLGDCAFNSGEAADYAQFVSLVKTLSAAGLPLHLALGNHDHRENFWTALKLTKKSKRPLADRQVALVKSSKVNWFMLDSLEATLQTPGFLGGEQLSWLAKALDANPRIPAVLLIHHNPGVREKIGGLKDTDALMEIIRPRRQVKAWIFGHTHKWRVNEDESGLHFVNLPPVAYPFRPEDPTGWVHVTARRQGMRLELRSLDPKHSGHQQVVDLKWRT